MGRKSLVTGMHRSNNLQTAALLAVLVLGQCAKERDSTRPGTLERFVLQDYRERHALVSYIYPRDYHPERYNASRPTLRIGYLTGSVAVPGKISYQCPGKQISAAITLAVDEINQSKDVLPDHNLEFVFAETMGQEEISITYTSLLPLKYNITAFIGPQETCIHEGRIATALNLPMISFFCAEDKVSDKALYPTFARTKPQNYQISASLVSFLLKYNWRKVVLVHSNDAPQAKVSDAVNDMMKKNGINVTDRQVYDGPYFAGGHYKTPFGKIVAETYMKTRIYVMVGTTYEFRALMHNLILRGLLDTGDYFVVGIDVAQYDPQDPGKFIQGLLTTRNKYFEDNQLSFRAFVGIAPAPPLYPHFKNFGNIINTYFDKAPFFFSNPYKYVQRKLRAETAYLYDAVWLYAKAADQAIKDGINPLNGTAVINYILGTTYESAMGYLNRIDRNGDCEGNFTLLGRKNGWDGWGLYQIGTFMINENSTGLPYLHFHEDIDWIGGRPPDDEPPCGFMGEKCIPEETYTSQIVGGILGGVVLIIVIIAVILYRNWRYEQDLASLLWKIDFKDIELKSHTSQYTGTASYTPMAIAKVNSMLRTSMMSLNSQGDVDFRQVFTQVGTYKGTIVAIKRINKRYVDLSRNVRKELKIVRDVRNDNLNPFIGACVDPGNVCIITEYSSKGSLQDILANDDVKLDNMFISSLVFDIIKGMIFLHDSVIRCHGRLKSSNCVVDSRWVLKITDYGLREFTAGAEADDERTEHSYFQSMLWTAPELLRDASAPPSGTQKGDIYSFAIILYEIHGRCGPYGDTDLTPKAVIQRVILPDGDVPFRPRLSRLDTVPKFITDTIKDCWNEDAILRPDFKTVRNKVKPIRKGMRNNIFDNMMAMMEKYATNLEEIVEERTDQLREEKKRTEELLHQMLPRSVAEQLKQGKQVEAEAFDSVTIYFSDICGFTTMSSESTPMQVVDLLNDLYTTFDSILENYDVYKVETIGDAYMVVSGLPKLNGMQHAGEIASMSLHLLSNIKKFKIRHRQHDTLKLRIGIHSGSCVAGVVGLKMPRYCLFGDTVNTASRMESNGQPLRIHCSDDTKQILEELGGYHLEDRGLVQMKGKGALKTYWLVGEDKGRRMSRLHPPFRTSSTTKRRSPKLGDRKVNMSLSIDSEAEVPVQTTTGNGDFPRDSLPNGYVSAHQNQAFDLQAVPSSPESKQRRSSGSVRRGSFPNRMDSTSARKPRRQGTQSSITIKIDDDLLSGGWPQIETDTEEEGLWHGKNISRENSATYCNEGSPLLTHATEHGDSDKTDQVCFKSRPSNGDICEQATVT